MRTHTPRHFTALAVLLTLGISATVPVRAVIPVIDTAALAQLIKSITYWQQQIQGMVNQLNQLQQTYAAMTGPRGFQNLLPITNAARNYLPEDWAGMVAALNGVNAGYGALSAQIQGLIQTQAILTDPQLAALNPQERALIVAARKNAAMLQVLSRTAQADTSQRFAALQQLITAIGGATDQKAILELQGRIHAEQTMLTNEQNKMNSLYQSAQGEELARAQQAREMTIQSTGDSLNLPPVAH